MTQKANAGDESGDLFSNNGGEKAAKREDKDKPKEAPPKTNNKQPDVKTLEIPTSKGDDRIASGFGDMTPEEVAIIRNTVAKGCSSLELAYFLSVCRTVNLNPFNKEVWAYKDNRGNLLIFTGRDGFLAKAQRDPAYNGLRSAEIREADEYEIDIPGGEIYHKVKAFGKDRGKILGAYAIVFRKDGEPTIELADFETYNKSRSAWNTHPAEMIKKVAETHALKKAFGISGLQSEYDFDFKQGVAIPKQTEEAVVV